MLDSRAPKMDLGDYMYLENRFKMLTKSMPEEAKQLLGQARDEIRARFQFYEYLAGRAEPAGRAASPAGDDGGAAPGLVKSHQGNAGGRE
jgi:hypothetical protein